MRNIHELVLREIEAGNRLALATLIETKGSTPQITGASALFSANGLLAGTLGGGLLEADGQRRALQALQSGVSAMYHCDLMSDISDPEGAICGGAAVVLVDAHPEKHAACFRAMTAALDRGLSGALLTCIGRRGGENALLERRWLAMSGGEAVPEGGEAEGGAGAPEGERFWYNARLADIAQAMSERKPVTLELRETVFGEEVTETLLYVEPAYPPPQLVITGAGHVGRALAHYGRLLDFKVTVIDDRPELTNNENIPDADHCIVGDIGEAVRRLAIRTDTYIVIVNRGHRGDADALRQCIASDAAYIGMIGSTRKVAQMRGKFLQEGWATEEQFDRVHAPVGLDIDAKSVEEIGISIAAELVAVRRGKLRRGDPR